MAEDFVQRGKELILRKEFQEAVRVCRLGLLGRPSQVEGRLLLATALLNLGRLDEVLAEMRVALEHEKENVLAHLIKGEALLRKGDARQAEEVFARVVQLDPDNGLAKRNLGIARARTEERFSQAEDRAWRAPTPPVEVQPEDVEEEAALDDLEAQKPRRGTTSAELDALLDELAQPPHDAPAEPRGEAPRSRPPTDPVPVVVVDERQGPVPLGAVGTPPDGRRTTVPGRPARRRSAALVVLGVVILAAAVWGGLALVNKRRDERVRGQVRDAESAATAQTLAGFRAAEEDLSQLLRDQDRPEVRGALLKVRAMMRAELGVGEGSIEDPRAAGPDADKAAAYLAMGTPQAVERARALPADAEALYLLGRALGRTPEGIAALEQSVQSSPTPFALAALGEAKAALGDDTAAASAFERALELSPGHPAAVVGQARFQARAGRLPAGPEPEASLQAMVSASATPKRQAALAALALAEVGLARGDFVRARAALAAGPRSNEPSTVEGRVAALLALGEIAAARAEAQASDLPEAPLWLAEVALAEKQPDAAAAALARAGTAAQSARGRRVAGRVALLRRDYSAAAAAFDEALRVDPRDARTRLLRAEVDVDRGDAVAARPRLEALYRETKDPLAGVMLADVLRTLGEHAVARGMIDEVLPRVGAEQGELPGRAHLTAARLYRDEGRLMAAQTEYANALVARPKDRDTRLEAARLSFDQGNLVAARAGLESLLADIPGDAEALLAAAEVRTVGGDPVAAWKLIDLAARRGAAKADVGRESGRAALAAGKPKDAVARLSAAAKAKPKDGETRLLLIDALVRAGAGAEAQREAEAVRKAFPDDVTGELARGRLGLLRGNAAEAVAGYAAAAKRLESGAPVRRRVAALMGLGRAQGLAGKPDAGAEALRTAAGLDAGAEPRLELGKLLLANKELPAASEALADAVKREPDLVEAWYLLGDVELQRRKKVSARYALNQVLKVSPRGPYAAAAKRLLRQAR